MNDIFLFKTTDNMDNRIGFANMGQKLIAQPLSLSSSFDKASYVHKLHCRVNRLFTLGYFRKLPQPRVLNIDHSNIRIDRAKGIV